MVVDDEWPALEQMRELLQQCENIASIHVFDNPREALTAAAELKPDLIFLDIQMPELSGLAFAENLQPFSPDTEVVFVSAYRSYAVEAFDLSAADYLLKPVDPPRLLRTWSKFLSKRTQSGQSGQPSPIARFQSLGGHILTGPLGSVKWSTHKAEELFAYLWIHRQGSVSVILNDVFPQWNYEKGKQYLHTTVYQIRKTLKNAALGDNIELTSDRENYRLEAKGIEGDAEQFQEAALAALQSNNPDSLRDASSLYKGELLQSLDSLWIYSVRDKYRQLYLKLLEQLTLGLIQSGRQYEAEEYALRLAELEPLEESYALQIIALYYETGKPLRAQRRFTQFCESYRNEMDGELPEWFLEAYKRLGT
ncbi:response regulator [Paenibacillus camerounensis]|uniref:response regulator n=1 Tax=Paenibacillus camerounensis TaxID=1243663 RepID=UPI000693672C|nr:response regulator [Paenibacillus camerounensis]